MGKRVLTQRLGVVRTLLKDTFNFASPLGGSYETTKQRSAFLFFSPFIYFPFVLHRHLISFPFSSSSRSLSHSLPEASRACENRAKSRTTLEASFSISRLVLQINKFSRRLDFSISRFSIWDNLFFSVYTI